MSTQSNSAASRADREIVISRLLNAPRELVWAAWTEKERLAQWWGPRGFAMGVSKLEMKPSDVFHYCMSTPLNATDEQREFFTLMRTNVQAGFKGTFDQLDAYLARAQA